MSYFIVVMVNFLLKVDPRVADSDCRKIAEKLLHIQSYLSAGYKGICFKMKGRGQYTRILWIV